MRGRFSESTTIAGNSLLVPAAPATSVRVQVVPSRLAYQTEGVYQPSADVATL
jgi:hypothetical protein